MGHLFEVVRAVQEDKIVPFCGLNTSEANFGSQIPKYGKTWAARMLEAGHEGSTEAYLQHLIDESRKHFKQDDIAGTNYEEALLACLKVRA